MLDVTRNGGGLRQHGRVREDSGSQSSDGCEGEESDRALPQTIACGRIGDVPANVKKPFLE